jgi:hypothetical protein
VRIHEITLNVNVNFVEHQISGYLSKERGVKKNNIIKIKKLSPELKKNILQRVFTN